MSRRDLVLDTSGDRTLTPSASFQPLVDFSFEKNTSLKHSSSQEQLLDTILDPVDPSIAETVGRLNSRFRQSYNAHVMLSSK